jgi:hypothetical protein
MNVTRALAAIVFAAGLVYAACAGGDDHPEFPRVIQLDGDAEVYPSILNSTLAAGDNRVLIGLIDAAEEPVLGADVSLRYYNLNDGTELVAETDARFVPIDLGYVDEQAPSPEPTESGDGGAYVSYVSFDEPGDWGVEITVTLDGEEVGRTPYRFNVLESPLEPAIGDPAPASMQMVLANVESIEDIDSSFPPRPAMHGTTIADAVASGRPSVIAFATPAYCQTRTCAPVMDTVMDPLFHEYGAEAHFIHVEPYVLRDLRESNVRTEVPALREWRLPSEPWIFVVDAEGRIAAKFEGIVARDEVESVLARLLGRALGADGWSPGRRASFAADSAAPSA